MYVDHNFLHLSVLLSLDSISHTSWKPKLPTSWETSIWSETSWNLERNKLQWQPLTYSDLKNLTEIVTPSTFIMSRWQVTRWHALR